MLTLTRSTLKQLCEKHGGRNDQPIFIKSADPKRFGCLPVTSITTARLVLNYYEDGASETYENFLEIEAGKDPQFRVKNPEIRHCILITTDEYEGSIFPTPEVGVFASSD